MAKVNYHEKYNNKTHGDILSDVSDLLQKKIGLSPPIIIELASLIKSQQGKATIRNIESCFGVTLTHMDHVALYNLRRAEQYLALSKRALFAVLSTYDGREME